VRTLREAREGRGWKLTECSAVTGISFGWLAKVERGEVTLSAGQRIRLIRALDLTADEVREIAELVVETLEPA
jgi:transcriptional regulator with XRE-family HTH domain